jgi:hypothetical protein
MTESPVVRGVPWVELVKTLWTLGSPQVSVVWGEVVREAGDRSADQDLPRQCTVRVLQKVSNERLALMKELTRTWAEERGARVGLYRIKGGVELRGVTFPPG